jgi:methionyl-tRNA formyltransferase
MRVAMFGYQTWGYRTLQALFDAGHEVALVVTHPASDHAYERIWDDSVAELAEKHGVPVLLRRRPDDPELLGALRDAAPDLAVANNWRTWLPPEIFRLPTHGTLNIHDSLLPAYAGFSPLIWALLNGERQVGVTAHRMDDTLDAGDVLLQRAVPVGPKDTATDLFHRTVELIGPVVRESLDLIASGRAEWLPQDRTRATFFHKRSEEDSGCASWRRRCPRAGTGERQAGSSSARATGSWSWRAARRRARAAGAACWCAGSGRTTARSTRPRTTSAGWATT